MKHYYKQQKHVYRTAGRGVLAMGLLAAASCLVIWSARRHPGGSPGDTPAAAERTISASYEGGVDELIEKRPASLAGMEKAAALRQKLGPLEGDSFYMDSSMGSMMYFSQKDPRWKDYLWGGSDPMSVYGCGPTAMAMIANAFGDRGPIIPVTMAEWCDMNGQRGAHAGSNHSIVMTALPEFGLTVESMQSSLTTEAMCDALRNGCVLVALVGPGYFTDGGHFIVIRGINDDGTVNIADPASAEHTRTPYDPAFILGELKSAASDAGGPLWSVSQTKSRTSD